MYGEIVGKIAERVKSVELGNAVIINVREMPIEGRAKIRHVGAWAVPISCEFKLITYDISDSNNPGFSEEVSGNEWCAWRICNRKRLAAATDIKTPGCIDSQRRDSIDPGV